MRTPVFYVSFGIVIGFLATLLFDSAPVRAQIAQSWSKGQVLPIIFVKPGIGNFVPEESNAIGVSWTKDQVMPVLLVKPYVTGEFVPLEGNIIGNTWTQEQVKPVVFVDPAPGGAFVASDSGDRVLQQTAPTGKGVCSPPIETQIDGEFNGWDGETVYRMADGSIWKQSTYHYHYAFDPEVIIFSSGSGSCHIKVNDDDDDGVDVIRLK